MAEPDVDGDEAREEIMPLHSSRSQRQHPSIAVTSGENEDQQSARKTSTTKPPGRATRFLSIIDASSQLPSTALLKLRQWHDRSIHNNQSFLNGEITDELLDKIPFQYSRDRHACLCHLFFAHLGLRSFPIGVMTWTLIKVQRRNLVRRIK